MSGRFFIAMGVTEVMGSTPEEYAAFLAEEQARWSAIIKAIGFKED